MKRLSFLAAALVIGGAFAGSIAHSQEGRRGDQHHGMDRGGSGMGMGGMMGGGMMQGCPMMSNRGSSPSALIPQLPPGNEKLQAQMTAEIMQKAGEIAAKYAAQVK